jgi:hypothetical protein
VVGGTATRAAQLTGQLVNTGGKPTQVFVHWRPRDGGNDPAKWASVPALGARIPGPFTTALTGLDREAVYYYRCSAANALGRGWAEVTERFSTPATATLTNDNALALHWTLDQLPGMKLVEASPNAVTGTLGGTKAWAPAKGVIGQAASFTSSGALTSALFRQPLRQDSPLSLWVQFPGKYDSGKKHFLCLQPAPLYLYISQMRPSLKDVAASATMQPNQWHLLTLTRRGQRLVLHLDAAPVATSNATLVDPYDQLLLRGADIGILDDLRIYRRALAAEETRLLHRRQE